MSHTVRVKSIPMRSRELIKKTASDLQKQGLRCELLENAIPRMFFKNQIKHDLGRKTNECDLVLKLDDSRFDVGFILQDNGSFMPVFDPHQGHVNRSLGQPYDRELADEFSLSHADFQIGKFLTQYAQNVGMESVHEQGYMVESSGTDEQGNPFVYVQVED